MGENDRQQHLIERVQEDERLRGDLTDEAATALVDWASRRVAAAAADPARPDADVEAEVQAIRAAARAAARAGEDDPPRVIAIAEATLTQQRAGPAQAQPDAAGASAPPAQSAAERTRLPPPQTGAPPAPERPQPAPAQTNAADPAKRRRISFWRRWSPFANIWNRFRGDR